MRILPFTLITLIPLFVTYILFASFPNAAIINEKNYTLQGSVAAYAVLAMLVNTIFRSSSGLKQLQLEDNQRKQVATIKKLTGSWVYVERLTEVINNMPQPTQERRGQAEVSMVNEGKIDIRGNSRDNNNNIINTWDVRDVIIRGDRIILIYSVSGENGRSPWEGLMELGIFTDNTKKVVNLSGSFRTIGLQRSGTVEFKRNEP